MKKSFRKFAVVTTTFCALALTSCSTDDEPFSPVDPQPVSGDLEGSITEDLTLDPTVDYKLTGSLLVKAGATLTIPAGTEIVAKPSPESYIIIEKGAKIDVKGTAADPVVMTSENQATGEDCLFWEMPPPPKVPTLWER